MAEKRMFTKKIIDSDAFLDMPLSTQALYFHLAMRADDDGFVNSPRKIVRLVSATDDDLRLLVTKRFILTFESGVIVIKHWWMHNTLRSDRYQPTDYQEEYRTLGLKPNKAYTDDPSFLLESASDNHVATTRKPTDNHMEPQNRIDKNRLDKNRLDKTIGEGETVLDQFELFWSVYPRKVGKEAARKAFAKVKEPVELLINAVEKQKQTEQWTREGGRFIPYPATWLNQGRWNDEIEIPVQKAGTGSFKPKNRPTPDINQTDSFKNSIAEFTASIDKGII